MRRRSSLFAALVALALLAWVAAPALSVRPYMPGAVDFEQRLPEAKRLPPATGAGAGRADPDAAGGHQDSEEAPRWISPPVEAPREFDLVGVAGEMRHLEIRAREEGGGWSAWLEQTEGTPVYVDGAREVQVRAAFKPRGRLHYVNVSGTAEDLPARLLHSARGAINSAFISVASLPPAEALAPKPRITYRAGWGANLPDGGCPPRGPAEYGSVRAAIVHHTVNANEYSPEEAPGIVLGICRFHVYGNGWNDLGYQALVDRFGNLYEGRAGGLKRPVIGAQAQGFNSQTTAIASIGEHTSIALSPKARGSVIRYLAWKMGMHGAQPTTKKTKLRSAGGAASRYSAGTVVSTRRIVGHGRLGLTACPGAALSAQVAGIRRKVQKRIKKFPKRKRRKSASGAGAGRDRS